MITHSPQPLGPTRSRIKFRAALLTLGIVLNPVVQAGEVRARSFADLSIEELMNESVTSVSKKAQRIGDAAAAISLLSNDDLLRSGATNLPDALRLLPGVNVGALNSSQSAVSVRGFNSIYSNKLLVLVDGRAVYNPHFAGVYWDLQTPMLGDIDRIEVVRGPGATMWGANAVNGVINVVSRSARDTLGGVVSVGGGDVEQRMGQARYGGQLGAGTYYRVFGSYQARADYPLANGRPAGDNWEGRHGGFRIDHYDRSASQLTWQGDVSAVDLDGGLSQAYNLNMLGRWSRQLSARSTVEVQVYVDRLNRDEISRARSTSDALDLSAQHTFGLGERNDVIWGLGYRSSDNTFEQTNPLLTVREPQFGLQLFSAFVQEEFRLVPDRLTLVAGVKLEHNDYTGLELQPTVRVVFKPSRQQTLWAAVSRAVRTPDAISGRNLAEIVGGEPIQGPDGTLFVPTILGNPRIASEVVRAFELGYRAQPAEFLSVDVATFYNVYDHLINTPTTPRLVSGVPRGVAELQLQNRSGGESWGAEASVIASPMRAWRLSSNYSYLVGRFEGPLLTASTLNSPRHQLSLQSSLQLSNKLSVDTGLRRVGSFGLVPAYLTADVRLSYRPHDRVELSLTGRNLLDNQQLEQSTVPLAVLAEVPRSFFGRMSWRF